MMKYLFLNIGIRQGEFVFDSLSVHEVQSDVSPVDFGTKYAQNFYGDEAQEDESENGEYWFDTLVTFLNEAKEISPQDYQVLKRFLEV